MKKHIVYIISDIHKSLAFEWIAESLDTDRFRLSFVLLNEGPSPLETFLQERGISVLRIPCAAKTQWPVAIARLIRFFRSDKPDVVHCHLFTANIVGLTAAKLAGVRERIYTRHHSDFHFRYFPKGVKWDKYCNRLATAIVAPSQVVADILIGREGVSPTKVHLIHHGFDLRYFSQPDATDVEELRRKYNPDARVPIVGVIARFTKLKGIQHTIPAFRRLLATFPNAKLLLFNARGDYAVEINALLSELPQGSFETISFEEKLAAVYPLFDVFVQVSIDREIEAFGQTYVEALAAGVPSVFTKAGVASEFLVHGENSVVAAFSSEEDIYNGMLRILQDKEFAEHLKENGQKTVQHLFSLSTMIGSLEALYSSEDKVKKQSGSYLPALTGVRAMAAGMVCLFHTNPFTERIFGKAVHGFFNELHVGVTFFFVLSGFLIAFRYQEQPKISFRKYFQNRFARIYPVYFLLTAVFFAIQVWQGRPLDASFGLSYFMNITLLRGFFEEFYFSGLLQGWSLTVEETFYLCAPLSFFLIRKWKGWVFALPFVFLVFGVLLVAAFSPAASDNYGFFGSIPFMISYTFFGRVVEFFVGIGLAMIYRRYLSQPRNANTASHKPWFTLGGAIGCVLCILLIASMADDPERHGIDTMGGKWINNLLLPFAIAAFYWGLISEHSGIRRLFSTGLFNILGKSSYAFYLIHLMVISWKPNFIFVWLVSVTLSLAVFYLIEEPLHKRLRAS